MKIALIAMTGLYPADLGGTAPVAYFLASELNKRDVAANVFIRADDEKLKSILDSKDISYLNKTKIIALDIQYSLKQIFSPFSTLRNILNFYNQFKNIIKKVDIVIYNSPPADITFLFPLIAWYYKKKQVIFIHGGLLYESNNFIGRLWLKIIRKIFDKIIAVSQFSKKLAMDFGFPHDKIIVINNGVPIEIIEKTEPMKLEGTPKILYVGRLATIKNVETILRSFKIILNTFPGARLYLVGDGPQILKIKKLANELFLYDKVFFIGFVQPGINVYKYYKSCDIFVMASFRENFPLTILEAMSAGIPFVLPDIQGGPGELVEDGENGFLFNPVDHEQMADRIITILSNQNIKSKFVNKNYETVKNKYSWSIIGERYFEVILGEKC